MAFTSDTKASRTENHSDYDGAVTPGDALNRVLRLDGMSSYFADTEGQGKDSDAQGTLSVAVHRRAHGDRPTLRHGSRYLSPANRSDAEQIPDNQDSRILGQYK